MLRVMKFLLKSIITWTLSFGFVSANMLQEPLIAFISPENPLEEQPLEPQLFLTRDQVVRHVEISWKVGDPAIKSDDKGNTCFYQGSVQTLLQPQPSQKPPTISKINCSGREVKFKQHNGHLFIQDAFLGVGTTTPLFDPTPDQLNGTKPYISLINSNVLGNKEEVDTDNFQIEIYPFYLQPSTTPNTYDLSVKQSITSTFAENYVALLKSGFINFNRDEIPIDNDWSILSVYHYIASRHNPNILKKILKNLEYFAKNLEYICAIPRFDESLFIQALKQDPNFDLQKFCPPRHLREPMTNEEWENRSAFEQGAIAILADKSKSYEEKMQELDKFYSTFRDYILKTGEESLKIIDAYIDDASENAIKRNQGQENPSIFTYFLVFTQSLLSWINNFFADII